MVNIYFFFESLTEDRVSTIKGIIYPEFVAKEQPATSNSTADEATLLIDNKVLRTLLSSKNA